VHTSAICYCRPPTFQCRLLSTSDSRELRSIYQFFNFSQFFVSSFWSLSVTYTLCFSHAILTYRFPVFSVLISYHPLRFQLLLQFYAETQQCERSMFHDVYRMHKELRDASLKPTADVSCLRATVEVCRLSKQTIPSRDWLQDRLYESSSHFVSHWVCKLVTVTNCQSRQESQGKSDAWIMLVPSSQILTELWACGSRIPNLPHLPSFL